MRAGVYVRISADPLGLRAGVDRQREDCLAECARRGWEAVVYEDNDRSAYSGKPRPGYQRMLSDLAQGAIGALVAWAPDRLTRHLRELEDLVTLIEKSGAVVVTLQAGEWDLTTPEGRFMARQLGLLARLEAEKIAARVRRARRQAAEAGLPHHGGGDAKRPWGFEPDRITHHPIEAEQVRDAARRLIRGESIRSVAKRYGKQTYNLKTYLTGHRVAGYREHAGRAHRAVWEPLLDEETWHAVRAVLSRPEPVSQAKARKYLLTGLLRCGICGAPVVGSAIRGRPAYRCRGCGNIRRFADALEDYVTGAVLERADMPGGDDADPALAAAVAGYEARLDEATEMWMEGALPKGKYLGLKQELEARLEEAQDRLAASVMPWRPTRAWLGGEEVDDEAVLLTVAKWRWWQEAEWDERRGLLTEYVDRIILNRIDSKTYRFEPGSIVIHWA